MTAVPAPALKLREPIDIITVIPYLLGFEPQESVVLVALHGDKLICTARLDFDDGAYNVLVQVYDKLIAAGADSFVVVVYGDGRTYTSKMLRLAVDLCPVEVGEGLWVANGNYGCIHPEGSEPIPLPATPSRVEAEAVVRGLVKAPSRAEVERTFKPLTDEDGLLFLWNTTRDQPPCDLVELIRSDVVWSVAVRFATAVEDIETRDAAWVEIDALERHEALVATAEQLREVARRVPASHRVAVLFLCAWAYWRDGQGAWANIALERAFEIDPDYSAAQLLQVTLQQAISPQSIPRLTVESLKAAAATDS